MEPDAQKLNQFSKILNALALEFRIIMPVNENSFLSMHRPGRLNPNEVHNQIKELSAIGLELCTKIPEDSKNKCVLDFEENISAIGKKDLSFLGGYMYDPQPIKNCLDVLYRCFPSINAIILKNNQVQEPFRDGESLTAQKLNSFIKRPMSSQVELNLEVLPKISELCSEEIRELEICILNNCPYSAAFLIRRILEKTLVEIFANYGFKEKIFNESKNQRKELDAIIGIACTEKIDKNPIITNQDASQLKSIKFIGNCSAHEFEVKYVVDRTDISNCIVLLRPVLKKLESHLIYSQKNV